MSNQLTVAKTQALVESSFTPEQLDLLKRTICKGATDDEFKLFLYIAKRAGLDPFTKQVHAVKRWNNKLGKEEMAVQVGIDGFRLIANRTGTYAGSDDPVFDDEKQPKRATVTVYKMLGGQRCPFTATARWDEYFPGEKQGFMWKKMPCVMLGKVAESLALRKAFPAELSGFYTDEEMEQADAQQKIVAPQQPMEGDGVARETGYRIPFGKYARRSLDEIDLNDLRSYVNYLESKAAKEGKTITGQVKEFIEMAEAHIAAFENAPLDGEDVP